MLNYLYQLNDNLHQIIDAFQSTLPPEKSQPSQMRNRGTCPSSILLYQNNDNSYYYFAVFFARGAQYRFTLSQKAFLGSKIMLGEHLFRLMFIGSI
jgi:hypothetical protein